VDKSNRRLSFAACLLIAAKINEANVEIAHDENTSAVASTSNNLDGRGIGRGRGNGGLAGGGALRRRGASVLQPCYRPTKKHGTVFASLLEFFTHEWSLSVKAIFEAEWGVFAALEFSLHATPSQVQFHFKRLMKALDESPLNYLGEEMYSQWQDTLRDECLRTEKSVERREARRRHKDAKLIELKKELMSCRSRNGGEGGAGDDPMKTNIGGTFHSRKPSRASSSPYDTRYVEDTFGIDCYKKQHSGDASEDGFDYEEEDYYNGMATCPEIAIAPSTPKRKGGGLGLLKCMGLKKGNFLASSPTFRDSKRGILLEDSMHAAVERGITRSISTPNIINRSRRDASGRNTLMTGLDINGGRVAEKQEPVGRKSGSTKARHLIHLA